MKKVLFHSPITYTPHWEIELNLMEKYLRLNYRVVLLICNGELPACIANPQHTFTRCLECKSRKQAGIEWIGKDRIEVKPFYYLTPEQKQELARLAKIKINSIDELKELEIDGSDIGMAVLSSVITSLRESVVDVEKHARLIGNFLQSAAMTHFSVTHHLQTEKPDELVIFNGRFASIRPALRAAWKLGITTYVHESAKVAGRYLYVKDDIIHSLRVWKKLLKDEFAKSDLSDAEKKKIAVSWFEERRRRDVKNQLLFTRNQENTLLPENFSEDFVNIGIFNSSEDEFVGFDEFQNLFYKNQNDGIEQILSSFINEPRIRFYLRMHPNLTGLTNSQITFLESIESRFPNVKLIKPDSPVDTYALIESCKLVITFASTIGIETVYAGKSSILLGRALYEDLEGIIKPQSHADFVFIINEYLKTGTLPDVGDGEKGFVKYGYFMKNAGIPLEFGESTEWWRVKMKRDGQEKFIKPSVPSRLMNMISPHLPNFHKRK